MCSPSKILMGEGGSWFRSYLKDQSYFVTVDKNESDKVALTCGIPQ